MAAAQTSAAPTWRSRALGSDPVRRAIYIVGMLPAVSTFYLGLMDQLGADPQKTLERTLGLWALRLLIACLAITPLRRLGGPNLVRHRRTLGLLAFYYAVLHLTAYTVLDQGLDLAAIWADIVKRPYITIGMLAFAVLVPLAAPPPGRCRMAAAAPLRLPGGCGRGFALRHAGEILDRRAADLCRIGSGAPVAAFGL